MLGSQLSNLSPSMGKIGCNGSNTGVDRSDIFTKAIKRTCDQPKIGRLAFGYRFERSALLIKLGKDLIKFLF